MREDDKEVWVNQRTREGPYVCVMGGANVDIQGFPDHELIYRDSNVGKVKISLGGVGRNVAENLVRLGIPTHLITVIGDDAYGRQILADAQRIGLDMHDTLVLPGEQTSTYLSILDHSMDMVLAINQMTIVDRMTVDFIASKRAVIARAALCVLDTNIPADVLRYLLTTFPDTVFFLDTVSTVKAGRVKELIGRAHTIKPNRAEAEVLSGMPIRDAADLDRAVATLHAKGVHSIFLSLGAEGLFYSNGQVARRLPTPPLRVVNATGAGDAALAGLTFGYWHGRSIDEMAALARAASIIALSSADTINPAMSEQLLDDTVKELASC